MRQRDSGIGRDGKRRADARHYFERYGRRTERLGLLTTASEKERVATLEPYDTLAARGPIDEQSVNLFLWRLSPAADFANIDTLGPWVRQSQQFWIDQIVIDNHVAGAEKVTRFEC